MLFKYRCLVNLLEEYAEYKNMYPPDVFKLFRKTGADDYILEFAELFGSECKEYNVQNIDDYMKFNTKPGLGR